MHLWQFNEASGTVTVDAVAGGIDLTVDAAASLGEASVLSSFGNALETSDGASSGAFGPEGVSMDSFRDAGTGAFTYEAIVKLGLDPNFDTVKMDILSMDDEGADAERGFRFSLDLANDQLVFENLGGSGGLQSITAALPATGAHRPFSFGWYHVAVTYDGAEGDTGNLRFYWTQMQTEAPYANEIPASGAMTSDLSSGTADLAIGNEARNDGTGHPWVGMIDEVRISNGARVREDMIFNDGFFAPTTPEIQVEIPGVGELENTIEIVDFGDTVIGESASTTLRITNIGDAELENLSLSVSGDTVFTIGSLGGVTQLGTGQHVDVSLDFLPVAEEVYAGVVSIMSNDGNESPFTIQVSGAGVSDPVNPDPNPTVEELVVEVAADAYVRGGNFANATYGNEDTIRVKDSSSSTYDRSSYLKFDVPAITNPVESVILRVKTKFLSSGNVNVSLYSVSDHSWIESEITFNNQPWGSTVLDQQDTAGVGEWVEFDVTDYVGEGGSMLSFQLRSFVDRDALFHSRETTETGAAPQLVIRTVPLPTIEVEQEVPSMADAYVKGGTDGGVNFGSANAIAVKQSNYAIYTRFAYLKFDVSAITDPVEMVILRVKAKTLPNGNLNVSVHPVADNSWTETGINFNNQPGGGVALDTQTTTGSGEWIEFDVTDYALSAGNTLSFQLRTPVDKIGDFYSKEATDPDAAPHLLVRTLSHQVLQPELTVEQGTSGPLSDGEVVEFGDVARGSESVMAITLRNDGAADLENLALSWNGDLAFSSEPLSTTTLAAGAETTISITFAPSVVGVANSTLQVSSNDPEQNPFTIQLTGSGLASDQEIRVERVNSGELTNGSTADLGQAEINSGLGVTLRIINDGDLDLTGLSLALSGGSEFTHNALSTSTLAAGESVEVLLGFTPSVQGAASGALSIASNDADESPFVVNLSATGVADATPTINSVQVTTVADAYVWGGNADDNYGNEPTMQLKQSSGTSVDRYSYLTFDLSSESGAVVTARLAVNVQSLPDGPLNINASPAQNNTWTETGITFNNQPGAGASVATARPIFAGEWLIFDVTSMIQAGGLVSIQLSTDDDKVVSLHTKESPLPELAPQLQVETEVVGTGHILRERWDNVTGSSVADIPLAIVPDEVSELTSFEISSNVANNYATRVSGFIRPPETGTYTFWISGDDHCELWLSQSGDPAEISRIAHVPGYTSPRRWDKYSEQQSVSVELVGGKAYYIEALHKEGAGNDNMAVAWAGPGFSQTVIEGQYLEPWDKGHDGSILREVWTGIEGAGTSSIPLSQLPDKVMKLVEFRIPSDDGDAYGDRLSGYLYPPETGAYTFWISGDNTAELFLSTDDNPDHATQIASLPDTTNPLEWDKFTQQQSLSINLVAGQRYYIEALHKEDYLQDHLAVAWAGPGITQQVITGAYLESSDTMPITGTVLSERWNNVFGSTVASIPTESTPDEVSELEVFEAPSSAGIRYGQKISGLLIPPATGPYTFYVAGDDNCELWLSTGMDPTNAVRIAHVPGFTSSREWGKYAEQQSVTVNLIEGEAYYIEGLHKQFYGGDNFAVGWNSPGLPLQVIDGQYLSVAPAEEE
jgi:hypothetical protein